MPAHLDLVGFFLLGLLGGAGHCLGMCSPFVLLVSRRFAATPAGRGATLRPQLLYGAGRLTTYAALGALAGLLGSVVDLAASMVGWQRAASAVAGALLVFFSLVGVLGQAPVGGPRLRLSQGVGSWLARHPPTNAWVAGLALGLLPCGLVYSALIAATAAGSAGRAAVALAVFGLGTLPAMLGLALADQLLSRPFPWLHRLGLLFMGLMGVGYLARALSAG